MTARTLIDEQVMVTLPDGATVDGHLRVEQEIIMVRSERAVLPDTKWRHTDAAGHIHQWDGREIPTLVHDYERRPCDGACRDSGCEGYSVDRWLCRRCGERVKPEYVPDWDARDYGVPIEGVTSWSLRMTGYDFPPLTDLYQCDVALATVGTPSRSFTGTASMVSQDMTRWGDGTRWTAELVGVGELSEAAHAS